MVKKTYERPALREAGSFRENTAGFRRRRADQLVGRRAI